MSTRLRSIPSFTEIHQVVQNVFGEADTRDHGHGHTVSLKFVRQRVFKNYVTFKKVMLLSNVKEQDGENTESIFTFWFDSD
jgi:hypothetical protein